MVRYIQSAGRPTEILNRNYTGDGSTVNFAVTQNQTNLKIIVTENGVVQKPGSDYDISGTTLTFTVAPASGVQIVLREMPI
jgi:hypothetical protein